VVEKIAVLGKFHRKAVAPKSSIPIKDRPIISNVRGKMKMNKRAITPNPMPPIKAY
jgi:hypothetical protein